LHIHVGFSRVDILFEIFSCSDLSEISSSYISGIN
jgi:hypothetical protein